MFVFTRRAIQQMLDDIAQWMPKQPLSELIRRLNTTQTNRLPQMWELVWLYALGKVVSVEHERPLPNGKPDVWFTVLDGNQTVPVVADITTLSDSALHSANPFNRLCEAVRQQARKVGLEGGGFHVAVSHLEAGASGSSKVKLLIPTGQAFDDLVKRHLKPFARQVAANPAVPNMLEVNEPDAQFTVEYKGPSRYSGGSHRSYDSALSRENNALFNRLSAKTKQLRGAPEGAVRMLVVCDGDCSMLSRDPLMEGFSAHEIAEHFLRSSHTIDLVLLVSVIEESVSIFARRDRRFLRCKLVASTSNRPAHLTTGVIEAVKRVFEEALQKLPEPKMMPNNALRRNLDSEWSTSMVGGYVQGGNRIKVSARAVLELLAGAMTYERFAELHRWNDGQFNMFRSCLNSGQIFISARIESLGSNEDDDWLEFEFGPPDAAISVFRLPQQSENAGYDSAIGP